MRIFIQISTQKVFTVSKFVPKILHKIETKSVDFVHDIPKNFSKIPFQTEVKKLKIIVKIMLKNVLIFVQISTQKVLTVFKFVPKILQKTETESVNSIPNILEKFLKFCHNIADCRHENIPERNG